MTSDWDEDLAEHMQALPTSRLIAAMAVAAVEGDRVLKLFMDEATFNALADGPRDTYMAAVARICEAVGDEVNHRIPPRRP